MDPLFIQGTAHTPEVDFQPENYKFKISGRSTPEDADIYYYPMIKYLDTIKKDLKTGFQSDKTLIFEFHLDYYNTASIRYLNTVMQKIESINEDHSVKVIWHYDRDDEYLKEMGDYFKDMFAISDIEYIEHEPPPRNPKKQ